MDKGKTSRFLILLLIKSLSKLTVISIKMNWTFWSIFLTISLSMTIPSPSLSLSNKIAPLQTPPMMAPVHYWIKKEERSFQIYLGHKFVIN